MSEDRYLPLRDLISESFLRDLILFLFMFLLILSQGWDNLLLLLLPLISFSFSIFFNLIHVNKWRTEFDERHLRYYPLGLEKKHANRLFFCALFQIILLYWIGAESLYHPQLIDSYAFFFIVIYIFLYSFGYYWIFIDLWKYARIEIVLDGIDMKFPEDSISSKNIENLINNLEIDHFKLISLISFGIFITLNILNILTALQTISFDVDIFQFYLNLPGTGIEGSQPISLSYIFCIVLLLPPIVTVIFLNSIYRKINSINTKRLSSVVSDLPRDIQIKVIENLKTLNKKIREQLRLE